MTHFPKMQVTWEDPESIYIPPDRYRTIQDDKVELISQSAERIGIKHPIHIRYVERMVIDGKEELSVPVCISGAHRTLAAIKVGLQQIPCFEFTDDDIAAELWEIDENLCRADLSPAEEAAHLQRRRELWNSGTSCPETRAPGRPQEFAAETATATGQSKRDINRKLRRAENVVVLGEIRGTCLDKGAELDALAEKPPAEQKALAKRAKSGEKVSAQDVLSEQEIADKQVKSLVRAWNKACPEARARFREFIDSPVMDKARGWS